MTEEITTEQIAQHYSAAMDSVALINAGQPAGMTDEHWAATVKRNKEHLKIILAKGENKWQASVKIILGIKFLRF